MSKAKIFPDKVSVVFFPAAKEFSDGGCHHKNEVVRRKPQTKTIDAEGVCTPAGIRTDYKPLTPHLVPHWGRFQKDRNKHLF